MIFSKKSAYLLVLSPMLTDPKGDPIKRRFEFEFDGFAKCLYLASFMANQKFPIPKLIYVRNDYKKASSYSASVIKYAGGVDWKNVDIDASIALKNNVSAHIKTAQQYNKLATGDLLMVVDNTNNDILKKIDKKIQPGNAILFADKDFDSMAYKIESGQPTKEKMLIENQFHELHILDSMDIGESCYKSESDFYKYHISHNDFPSYTADDENNEKRMDEIYSKLSAAQNQSNKIDNFHGIGKEYFAKELNKHIKTFNQELYAVKGFPQASK